MKNWLSKHWKAALYCYLGYLFSWLGGWLLSFNFETITNISSWFFPAGVRIASLLFIPRKYWPILLLAEITAVYTVNTSLLSEQTVIEVIFSTFSPFVIIATSMFAYLRFWKNVRFNSFIHLINLMFWIIIGTAINTLAFISYLVTKDIVSIEQFYSTLYTFMMGDFIGILLVLPFVNLMIALLTDDHFNASAFGRLLSISAVFIVIVTALLIALPQSAAYLPYMSLVLALLFAYRSGWLGASVSVLTIGTLLMISSLVSSEFETILNNQLAIILSLLLGLLIGSLPDNQRKIKYLLGKRN